MLFVVEVVPRSVDDARISIAIEAADQLEALRQGLGEIGLESDWVGPAVVTPAGEGALHVAAPGGGLAFVVRRVEPDASRGTFEASGDLLAPAEEAAVVAPLPSTDDEVLDVSRLELYFADEDEPEVAAKPVLQRPDETTARPPEAVVEAPSAAEGDRRPAVILARLSDLEDFVYDVSGAMEHAARALLEPLAADVACVLLLERRGKALGFGGLAGAAPPRLARYRYPKGLGLPWLAFDERRALRVNGIDRDAGLHREVQEKTGFRIRATILAPILAEGRTWGVVQAVRSAPDAPDFGDAEVAALESAARRLGAYLALFGTYL